MQTRKRQRHFILQRFDRLESIPAVSGWHGFVEQEMAISVSHPSFIALSMTLALLLPCWALVAMGVIVKRLEQNG